MSKMRSDQILFLSSILAAHFDFIVTRPVFLSCLELVFVE